MKFSAGECDLEVSTAGSVIVLIQKMLKTVVLNAPFVIVLWVPLTLSLAYP